MLYYHNCRCSNRSKGVCLCKYLIISAQIYVYSGGATEPVVVTPAAVQ